MGCNLETETGHRPARRGAAQLPISRGQRAGAREWSRRRKLDILRRVAARARQETLDDARSAADARRLLRAALEQVLDGRELRTREVALAMRALGRDAGAG